MAAQKVSLYNLTGKASTSHYKHHLHSCCIGRADWHRTEDYHRWCFGTDLLLTTKALQIHTTTLLSQRQVSIGLCGSHNSRSLVLRRLETGLGCYKGVHCTSLRGILRAQLCLVVLALVRGGWKSVCWSARGWSEGKMQSYPFSQTKC